MRSGVRATRSKRTTSGFTPPNCVANWRPIPPGRATCSPSRESGTGLLRSRDRFQRCGRSQAGMRCLENGGATATSYSIFLGVGVSLPQTLKRLLLGSPLATAQAKYERLGKISALAIFASDMMSSVAYATEEILLVLVLENFRPPVLYPDRDCYRPAGGHGGELVLADNSCLSSGGGAYVVASDNLGTLPGLIAGAALLVDYVLTVAVSTASGVAAITSAFPALFPHRVAICVSFVILVMVANLRGIRETGQIFTVPTYWFIGCLVLLVGGGFYSLLSQGPPPPPEVVAAQEPLTIFLVLRAFSGGCAALTERSGRQRGAVLSPAESRNAGITLVWMASILACPFLGHIPGHYYHIVPKAEETVVSMLARELFGRGGSIT